MFGHVSVSPSEDEREQVSATEPNEPGQSRPYHVHCTTARPKSKIRLSRLPTLCYNIPTQSMLCGAVRTMNILNVGYDSTNYYLIGPDNARLLIDVGWPGTLPKLLNQLKRKDIALASIKHLLITHYHPDHAGLAQELKDQGVRLIVLDSQIAAIPRLRQYIKLSYPYREIALHDNIRLRADASRSFLQGIGIEGEIISTPGHSEDSVTLILDEGLAFTGDLPLPMFATEEASALVNASWERIRAHHAKTIYPAHGPVRPLE